MSLFQTVPHVPERESERPLEPLPDVARKILAGGQFGDADAVRLAAAYLHLVEETGE